MRIVQKVALVFTIIGAINWGLIGLFDFNLVGWISMGNTLVERIIYTLVGIASIFIGISLFLYKGNLPLNPREDNRTVL